MNSELMYVDVILPLALRDLYTYAVPSHLQEKIEPGQRVVVQFGKQKVYAALIYKIHSDAPVSYAVKEILEVIDERPVITQKQFNLWQWIADYYLCTLGEVMLAGLPSALRLQSETRIIRNSDFDGDTSVLNDREYLVWEALEMKPELSVNEISQILSLKQVMNVIRNLINKKAVVVYEEVIEKYKPRFIEMLCLSPMMMSDNVLSEEMNKLEKKAPKQLDILLAFLQLSKDLNQEKISKNYLLKKAGGKSAALKSLIDKNIFISTSHQSDRLPVYEGIISAPKQLNTFQQQSLKEIQFAFEEGKVTMLHGVTSSGKTEIYIHLIEEMLDAGKQVLYLLPEIALTTQVIVRLQKHFGDRLLIYHSRFNEQERVEVWNKILDDNLNEKAARIIVGARSAIFLPFEKLGLIVVDEEHDHSYKQEDPAPRYNARDAAVVLASQQDARILLGTATPGLESYFNALSGKYALVNLEKRHAELNMPQVSIVDLRDARKRKQVNGNFSAQLIKDIGIAIEKREQVILFQNRRGFAPFLECNNCSWVPLCVNCDVALTYHKVKHECRCHYCGYLIAPPTKCNACGDADLRMRGFGTERIEEDLQLILPDARIARLDYDTTRSKLGFSKILTAFEEGEIDVLVGTQMVTKGLDFDRVSLVGIINADSLLHYPDFRSYERAFQLLSQVSGRAGRKKENGRVLVQTYDPANVVLRYVLNHDFRGFYENELMERYKFSYPPYFRLIEIKMKHKDDKEIDRASIELTKELKKMFGKRIMGPTIPTVTRVRNLYLRNVMIKLEKTLSVAEVKRKLMAAIDKFKLHPENRSLIIQIDVDPV